MFSYDWDWSVIWIYRRALLDGLGLTLMITAISIVGGTVGGVPLGVAVSGQGLAGVPRKVLLLGIDAIRSLPILILILLFYYWLPFAVGLRSSFWLATLALAVNLAAFVADVVRGAIDGVPRPQREAGYAIGMTRSQVMRRIVLPEAIRSVIPTLALLYIHILKMSSLASVIAVEEVVYKASRASSVTYRFLEVYAVLAVIYLALVLPFSLAVRGLENSEWFLKRSGH